MRMRMKLRSTIKYLFILGILFYFGLYLVLLLQSYYCVPCEQHIYNNANKDGSVTERKSSIDQPESSDGRLTVFLFILVLTVPRNIERRDAMRSTWLNTIPNSSDVTFRFVIGGRNLSDEMKEDLKHEQDLNKDLLLMDNFEEAYNKLTEKLLKSLLWVNTNVKSSFVMKVDDDSFVRLDVIVSELHIKYKNIDNLYWGFHRGSSRVKYSGKWAEKKWILCDHYLPYALGGGYIISHKLVQYIANISSFLVLYNSEDVSLGTWLSPIKLTRVHDTRFDTEWQSRGCKNVHIVSHKQTITDMLDKAEELKKFNRLCHKEEYLRKSFNYNWNVSPSQCCDRRDGIP